MANTAHLVRRQSSRDLKPQKSIDKLEMKEMRGRLMVDSRKNIATANYGATNAAFEDTSPNKVHDFCRKHRMNSNEIKFNEFDFPSRTNSQDDIKMTSLWLHFDIILIFIRLFVLLGFIDPRP